MKTLVESRYMQSKFEVNGRSLQITTDPFTRLLDILRDEYDLVAAKEGCGKGECGSCTVFMNGRRVNACLIPALQLNGSRIYTLEGIQNWPVFEAVEHIFIQQGAVQCGFCIPGMVMAALAFINEEDPPFTADQIKPGIAGNMCRCTGYTKIIQTLEHIGHDQKLIRKIKKDWPA